MKPTIIDPMLFSFCSPGQLEKLQAVEKYGSLRAAGRALGIDYTGILRSIDVVKKRAALQGYAPGHDMTHVVPQGFAVKGVSTYYDKDGKPRGQWVKSKSDQAQAEQVLRDLVAELMQEVPREKPAKAPPKALPHLCNVLTLTDCHVGAYAWGKETGAAWDLAIAERDIVAAARHLIHACPPAETCVVAQLGDFLHQDGLAAVTPTSGHQLDSDSRFSKVVQVATRILRQVIRDALAKHARVIVLMAEGNHDLASSVWLRHLFALLFEHEPRVKVIDSELPYYCHQHGSVMLGWHHGHLRKPDDLPLIFAAQFPQVWGTTARRYIHSGHLHHKHEREHNGCTVIQHPTLAARDAYAARGGWLADREMTAITYSDKHGQVSRATVCPEML